MARELIFTRHGESTVNVTRTITNGPNDYAPLTDLGRSQAQQLADGLQARDVIAIYASPLMRARETAGIIGEALGLPVALEDGLREPYCGIAEGRSDDEAWAMHYRASMEWRAGDVDYRIPNGESLRDVRNRFVPVVEKAVATHEGENGTVVLVSHGSVLMHMLLEILPNLTPDFVAANPLRNCDYIVVAVTDAGLSCVEWADKEINREADSTAF